MAGPDVQSAEHLARLREQPELKVALLRLLPAADAPEARFERSAKNTRYWPAVLDLADHFLRLGHAEELRQECGFYGRPCWLLATRLAPAADAPYAIAVAAADGAGSEVLVEHLRNVSRDYWFGSDFWK